LLIGERPTDRPKILLELFLIARADDDVYNGGTVQQPIQRNLRNCLAGLLRNVVKDIDDSEDVIVVSRRLASSPAGCDTASLRRVAAADLARQAAEARRTPRHQQMP
jgi:hypothetical protein